MLGQGQLQRSLRVVHGDGRPAAIRRIESDIPVHASLRAATV
jgi:hypothetical protein